MSQNHLVKTRQSTNMARNQRQDELERYFLSEKRSSTFPSRRRAPGRVHWSPTHKAHRKAATPETSVDTNGDPAIDLRGLLPSIPSILAVRLRDHQVPEQEPEIALAEIPGSPDYGEAEEEAERKLSAVDIRLEFHILLTFTAPWLSLQITSSNICSVGGVCDLCSICNSMGYPPVWFIERVTYGHCDNKIRTIQCDLYTMDHIYCKRVNSQWQNFALVQIHNNYFVQES